MEVFFYVFIPVAVAWLANYALTLIVPKEALQHGKDAKDGEREKFGKPQRKSREESDIVDRHETREASQPSSIVAREQARKSERVVPTPVEVEPADFDIPADFNMAEFSSARD